MLSFFSPSKVRREEPADSTGGASGDSTNSAALSALTAAHGDTDTAAQLSVLKGHYEGQLRQLRAENEALIRRVADADAISAAQNGQILELQREVNDLVWQTQEAEATIQDLRTLDYSRLEEALQEAKAYGEAAERERRNLMDEAEGLRTTISMLQQHVRQQEGERQAALAAAAQATEHPDSSEHLTALRAELDDARHQLQVAQGEAERNAARAAAAESQFAALEVQREAVCAQVAELQQQLEATHQQLQEAQNAVHTLSDELHHAQASAAHDHHAAALSAELSALQEQVSQLQIALASAQAAAAVPRAEEAGLQAALEQSSKEVASLAGVVASLEARCAAVEADAAGLRTRAEAAEQEATGLTAIIHTLTQTNEQSLAALTAERERVLQLQLQSLEHAPVQTSGNAQQQLAADDALTSADLVSASGSLGGMAAQRVLRMLTAEAGYTDSDEAAVAAGLSRLATSQGFAKAKALLAETRTRLLPASTADASGPALEALQAELDSWRTAAESARADSAAAAHAAWEAEQREATATAEVARLSAECGKLQNTQLELDQRVRELESLCGSWEEQYRVASDMHTEAQAQAAATANAYKELEGAYQALSSQFDSVTVERNAVAEQLGGTQQQASELTDQLQESEQRFAEAVAAYEQLQQRIVELENELQAAEQRAAGAMSASAEVAQAAEQLAAAEATIAELRAAVEASDQDRTRMLVEREEHERRLSELQEALVAAEGEAVAARGAADTAEGRLREAEAAASSLQAQVDTAQAAMKDTDALLEEHTALQMRLADVDAERSQQSQRAAELQAALEAADGIVAAVRRELAEAQSELQQAKEESRLSSVRLIWLDSQIAEERHSREQERRQAADRISDLEAEVAAATASAEQLRQQLDDERHRVTASTQHAEAAVSRCEKEGHIPRAQHEAEMEELREAANAALQEWQAAVHALESELQQCKASQEVDRGVIKAVMSTLEEERTAMKARITMVRVAVQEELGAVKARMEAAAQEALSEAGRIRELAYSEGKEEGLRLGKEATAAQADAMAAERIAQLAGTLESDTGASNMRVTADAVAAALQKARAEAEVAIAAEREKRKRDRVEAEEKVRKRLAAEHEAAAARIAAEGARVRAELTPQLDQYKQDVEHLTALLSNSSKREEELTQRVAAVETELTAAQQASLEAQTAVASAQQAYEQSEQQWRRSMEDVQMQLNDAEERAASATSALTSTDADGLRARVAAAEAEAGQLRMEFERLQRDLADTIVARDTASTTLMQVRLECDQLLEGARRDSAAAGYAEAIAELQALEEQHGALSSLILRSEQDAGANIWSSALGQTLQGMLVPIAEQVSSIRIGAAAEAAARVEEAIAAQHAEMAELKRQLESAASAFESAEEKYKDDMLTSSEQLEAYFDEKERIAAELAQVRARLAAAEAAVSAASSNAPPTAADASAEVSELRMAVEEYQDMIGNLHAQQAEVQQRIDTLEQAVEAARGERDELMSQLENARAEIASYDQEVSQLRAEVDKLRAVGPLPAVEDATDAATQPAAVSTPQPSRSTAGASKLAALSPEERSLVATRVLKGVTEYDVPLCTCEEEGGNAESAAPPVVAPLPLPVPVHEADVVRGLMAQLAEQEAEILLLRSAVGVRPGEGRAELMRSLLQSRVQASTSPGTLVRAASILRARAQGGVGATGLQLDDVSLLHALLPGAAEPAVPAVQGAGHAAPSAVSGFPAALSPSSAAAVAVVDDMIAIVEAVDHKNKQREEKAARLSRASTRAHSVSSDAGHEYLGIGAAAVSAEDVTAQLAPLAAAERAGALAEQLQEGIVRDELLSADLQEAATSALTAVAAAQVAEALEQAASASAGFSMDVVEPHAQMVTGGEEETAGVYGTEAEGAQVTVPEVVNADTMEADAAAEEAALAASSAAGEAQEWLAHCQPDAPVDPSVWLMWFDLEEKRLLHQTETEEAAGLTPKHTAEQITAYYDSVRQELSTRFEQVGAVVGQIEQLVQFMNEALASEVTTAEQQEQADNAAAQRAELEAHLDALIMQLRADLQTAVCAHFGLDAVTLQPLRAAPAEAAAAEVAPETAESEPATDGHTASAEAEMDIVAEDNAQESAAAGLVEPIVAAEEQGDAAPALADEGEVVANPAAEEADLTSRIEAAWEQVRLCDAQWQAVHAHLSEQYNQQAAELVDADLVAALTAHIQQEYDRLFSEYNAQRGELCGVLQGLGVDVAAGEAAAAEPAAAEQQPQEETAPTLALLPSADSGPTGFDTYIQEDEGGGAGDVAHLNIARVPSAEEGLGKDTVFAGFTPYVGGVGFSVSDADAALPSSRSGMTSEYASRADYKAYLQHRASQLAQDNEWDSANAAAWVEREYNAWVRSEGAFVPEEAAAAEQSPSPSPTAEVLQEQEGLANAYAAAANHAAPVLQAAPASVPSDPHSFVSRAAGGAVAMPAAVTASSSSSSGNVVGGRIRARSSSMGSTASSVHSVGVGPSAYHRRRSSISQQNQQAAAAAVAAVAAEASKPPLVPMLAVPPMSAAGPAVMPASALLSGRPGTSRTGGSKPYPRYATMSEQDALAKVKKEKEQAAASSSVFGRLFGRGKAADTAEAPPPATFDASRPPPILSTPALTPASLSQPPTPATALPQPLAGLNVFNPAAVAPPAEGAGAVAEASAAWGPLSEAPAPADAAQEAPGQQGMYLSEEQIAAMSPEEQERYFAQLQEYLQLE